MFCLNCGNNLGDYNYAYCPYCGADLMQQQANPSLYCENLQANSQYNQPNGATPVDPGKNIAIAALVLGVLPFIGIGGPLCSIPAWILGNKYGTVGNGQNASMANVGKICGIINTVSALLACILVVGMLVTFSLFPESLADLLDSAFYA